MAAISLLSSKIPARFGSPFTVVCVQERVALRALLQKLKRRDWKNAMTMPARLIFCKAFRHLPLFLILYAKILRPRAVLVLEDCSRNLPFVPAVLFHMLVPDLP